MILYGCGDFIDDYEGIRGYETFRSDLRLMYFARVDAVSGRLEQLTCVPLEARQLSLQRASFDDARWLSDVLSAASMRFETRMLVRGDGELILDQEDPDDEARTPHG